MLKIDRDSILEKDMAKKTGNRKKMRPQMYHSLKETKDKMITDKISRMGEPR